MPRLPKMPKLPKVPAWLHDAVFYEIYPQSFRDTNGDGIGDIPGIIEKLDYLQRLGINALWLNPCFDSPFLDAGYDVRDFRKVAPRYGTNVDLRRLFREAKARGIRVCLDFVAPHTSLDHPWFLASCKHAPNRYTNRYIWTDSMYSAPSPLPFLQGYGEREGAVATNFFYCQPKLNFGYLQPDPSKPWQLPMDHPDVQALWKEMMDIACFWLKMGAAGFRCDSAKSLVVGDPRKGTARFWRTLRARMAKGCFFILSTPPRK